MTDRAAVDCYNRLWQAAPLARGGAMGTATATPTMDRQSLARRPLRMGATPCGTSTEIARRRQEATVSVRPEGVNFTPLVPEGGVRVPYDASSTGRSHAAR